MPIDLPMDALFPPGRRQERVVESIKAPLAPFDAATSISEKYGLSDKTEVISKATELVFSLPSVGSKMFLITIADRVRKTSFRTNICVGTDSPRRLLVD